jgi:hypothetical protein
MATRRVTLPEVPGVAFILKEGETLDDARRNAILGGHATAEEVFPRPDIPAAEREALAANARRQGIVPSFLAGTRGRLRTMAAGLASPEAQAEFEARERPGIQALAQESTAAQIGSALPDVGLLGRAGFRGGVTGEGAIGATAAPPGETIIGGVEGLLGGLVGEGVGRGVGLGVRGITEGVRSTIEFAQRQATGFREARAEGARQAAEAAGIVEEVAPVESAADLLERARGTSTRVIDAQALEVTGDVNIPDERARLVARADDLGFQLSTGQRTGSIPQQQVDAGFASNPLLSRPFVEAAESNNRQYARTLLRAIGEPAGDAVTPQALGRANERLGGDFRDIAEDLGDDPLAGGKVRFIGDLSTAIRGELSDPRIRGRSVGDIPPHLRGKTVSPTLQGMIDDLDSGAPVSGAQLMAWRSALTDDVMRFSEQGSGALGTATTTANAAIDAIDDAIVRGGTGDVAERYIEARSQWRVLQSAENILRDPLGTVSAKRMNTELLRTVPFEYRRGGLTGANPGGRSEQLQNVADFFDATRIGAGILPEVVANSGTPTRQFISMMMAQGAESATGAAGQLARQAVLGDVAGQVAFNRGRVIGGPIPGLEVLPVAGRALGGAGAGAEEVLRANQQSLLDQFFGEQDATVGR